MNTHSVVAAVARLGLASLLWVRPGPAAEPAIDITHDAAGRPRLVPVAVSGFTGEVNTALQFDLSVMGFEIVPPDRAQFLVHGSNPGDVQGRVTDAVNKAVLLARQYTGGTPRSRAHAFADEIVETLTGRKGIARTKIAFKLDTGSNSEIYVADYDGFNAVAVTRDNAIAAAPAWVPGRRMLYYTSYRQGNPDIYSHDLTTGDRREVARYSGLNTSAAVSPDGRRVAMILSKGGSPDLYVAEATGGNLRRLTETPEEESSPCWAPDGRTICVTSRVRGRGELYAVPAEGGPMRRIATVGVLNATEPDWSPDGKQIVFTRMRSGASPFDVCVVPAGGGEATVLVEGEDPSWAPNSRTVIFTRRSGDAKVLSLLDVPTKRYKDVPHKLGRSSQPAWAR